MSTVVCQQGVLVEATIMKLKLVAPKEASRDVFGGDWRVVQSKKESSYVDPWANKWRLSPKSLELCTEGLGSETGSDTTGGDGVFSFLTTPVGDTRNESKSAPKEKERNNLVVAQVEPKRKVVSRGFPPPLTTISSRNLLYVREGGRLIIQATETTMGNGGCFQAERSGGRLRLMCWRSGDSNLDTQRDVSGLGIHDDDDDDDEDEEEEEEEDVQKNVYEMGKQKFQRPSRCKENGHGDKGLCSNWNPLWLATS